MNTITIQIMYDDMRWDEVIAAELNNTVTMLKIPLSTSSLLCHNDK